MRHVVITIALFLFSNLPVLAHDGSEHTSDLEMWVAGMGVILIIGVSVNILWWKRLNPDELVEYSSFEVSSEVSAKD